MRVIAKAYSDRPLDRVAVGAAGNVVYIAAESVASAMPDGELGGVGFPRDCVFAYDANLLAELHQAWLSEDEPILRAAWAKAIPASVSVRVTA